MVSKVCDRENFNAKLIKVAENAMRIGPVTAALAIVTFFGTPVSAGVLKMDSENNSRGGILRSGPIEVSLKTRTSVNENGSEITQPEAIIRVQGAEVGRLIGANNWGDTPIALIQIAQMDPTNPYQEVLLSSFTGGAHCCNQIQVLTSDSSGLNWREVKLGPFDGATTKAQDLLRSGRFLIVDIDNRFLYRFACYACSTAPTRIWQLQGTQFVDVSRRSEFLLLHRRNLKRMSGWFSQDNNGSPNGFLAGYVANKALVGELYDGWKRMIKFYDPTSDWGLKECVDGIDNAGNCNGREVVFTNYPEALKAFLINTGYIKYEQALPGAP